MSNVPVDKDIKKIRSLAGINEDSGGLSLVMNIKGRDTPLIMRGNAEELYTVYKVLTRNQIAFGGRVSDGTNFGVSAEEYFQ